MNNSIPDDEVKPLHKPRAHHGKVLLATEAKQCEECSEAFHLGSELVRRIVQNIHNDQKKRTLIFLSRFARGKEEENSNPYYGEIPSVSGK